MTLAPATPCERCGHARHDYTECGEPTQWIGWTVFARCACKGEIEVIR